MDLAELPLADLPLTVGLSLLRDKNGKCVTNVPRLIVHHSPDGFNFGYAGSGPADLALNWLEWFLRSYLKWTAEEHTVVKCHKGVCFHTAWVLHQEFKQKFIAIVSEEGGAVIGFSILKQWTVDKLANMGQA